MSRRYFEVGVFELVMPDHPKVDKALFRGNLEPIYDAMATLNAALQPLEEEKNGEADKV
jgi:hypothetical protein